MGHASTSDPGTVRSSKLSERIYALPTAVTGIHADGTVTSHALPGADALPCEIVRVCDGNPWTSLAFGNAVVRSVPP